MVGGGVRRRPPSNCPSSDRRHWNNARLIKPPDGLKRALRELWKDEPARADFQSAFCACSLNWS
jgi:hypothetical protein